MTRMDWNRSRRRELGHAGIDRRDEQSSSGTSYKPRLALDVLQRARFNEIIRDGLKSPRLSDWQIGFLTRLLGESRKWGEKWALTTKQVATFVTIEQLVYESSLPRCGRCQVELSPGNSYCSRCREDA